MRRTAIECSVPSIFLLAREGNVSRIRMTGSVASGDPGVQGKMADLTVSYFHYAPAFELGPLYFFVVPPRCLCEDST